MNIKEILEANKNEDGSLNLTELENALNGVVIEQTGAVASKTKNKYKEQLEILENEKKELESKLEAKLENAKSSENELLKVITDLSDKVNNLEEKNKKEKEIKEFKKKAKQKKIAEELVDAFIFSGADLKKVDFETFEKSGKIEGKPNPIPQFSKNEEKEEKASESGLLDLFKNYGKRK